MAIKRLGPDCVRFRKIRQWLRNRKARRMLGCFGKGSEWRQGAYASYAHHVLIGENVAIRDGVVLFADEESIIDIGNDVLIGMGVHIYTSNHVQGSAEEYVSAGVGIHSEAWIGANATILMGVTIGRNSVVGAGSVVTKDVPDGEVWAGNPCRRIKGKQKETEDVKQEEIPLYYSSKRREPRSQGQEHQDIQQKTTPVLGLRRRSRE